MSDAAIFVSFFGGILVVRLIAATLVFVFLIPRTLACPHCNAETLRIRSRGWNVLMPWFRTSWCIACGWEGMLRHPRPHLPAAPRLASSARPRVPSA
jgi:hypothetical protein